MEECYTSKTDAIERGIKPALGDFVNDYDLDEIYKRYYTVRNNVDDEGTQNGDCEIVPRWTLEHPDREEQDGIDLFWEIASKYALRPAAEFPWPEDCERVGRLLEDSYVSDGEGHVYFVYNDLGSIACADLRTDSLTYCQSFMRSWGECLRQGDDDAFLHAVPSALGKTVIIDSPEYVAEELLIDDKEGWWAESYENTVIDLSDGLKRGDCAELTPEALLSAFFENDLMLTRREIDLLYPGVMKEMDRLGLSEYVEKSTSEDELVYLNAETNGLGPRERDRDQSILR